MIDMAILKKLKDYLEKNQVSYEVGYPARVYTAQEIAATQHVPGKEVAKVVMVKADGMKIQYSDYDQLVKPKVGNFRVHL
jgi:hypothetical protein